LNKVVDLQEYKISKTRRHIVPYFQNNTMLTLKHEGNMIKYMILANIVLSGKQIVAMERVDEVEKNIGIAELIIEKSKVTGVQSLSEEEFDEASELFDRMMNDITKKDH
jgi:hypothetical protein